MIPSVPSMLDELSEQSNGQIQIEVSDNEEEEKEMACVRPSNIQQSTNELEHNLNSGEFNDLGENNANSIELKVSN